MNINQITAAIFSGAELLRDRRLPYLTGRNYFTPTQVEPDRIRGIRENAENPDISISRQTVENYAAFLATGQPVHIENALEGSGNDRSALETVVAHLPNAGFITNGGVPNHVGKHVIWSDTEINVLGESRNVTANWRELAGLASGVTENLIGNSTLTRALLAKPFLILTGPSGTGKTRGAIELARAICDEGSSAVIAVGADWTDNRHVLGYLNPLQTQNGEAGGIPIYETTPVLELILHANDPANRDKPHVLILDEMNLSHVERYFADSLSAMELDEKKNALKMHAAGTAKTRDEKDVLGSINFPENLFVIGTVNIDETTYMFSPKVLDRANVIEIHAEETALEKFLKRAEVSESDEAPRDYGISFLEAARMIRNEMGNEHVPELPPTVRVAAADHLMALFRIMKRGRGEFGFRTGKEVMAYLRAAHLLVGPAAAGQSDWAKVATTGEESHGAWMIALDEQILQKILPKLHGSRSRLSQLLGALATYCATGVEGSALEHFPGGDGASPKRVLSDAKGLASPKFAKSYEKLSRMITVLVEEQFVSFIC